MKKKDDDERYERGMSKGQKKRFERDDAKNDMKLRAKVMKGPKGPRPPMRKSSRGR